MHFIENYGAFESNFNEIYLPMYWVGLSWNSRMIVNFFLFWGKKKVNNPPWVNSALEQMHFTFDMDPFSKLSRPWNNICRDVNSPKKWVNKFVSWEFIYWPLVQIQGSYENKQICFWDLLTFISSYRSVDFRTSLWSLQFSQKTDKKIWLYYYGTSSTIVFVGFLGGLNTPQRHFEINRPLKHIWFGTTAYDN